MPEINDWKEVPVDDWKEVPVSEQKTVSPGILPWIGKTISNVPTDAAQAASTFVYPFIHPVQTAKGVASIGKGLTEMAVPGTFPGYEEYPKAIGRDIAYKVTHPSQTIQEHPVQSLMDVASALSGIGLVGRVIPGLGQAGQIISKVGKVGKVIEPVNAAKKAVGAAISIIPKGSRLSPEGLYASAAKMPKSKKWGLERREQAAEMGLKESIPLTQGGYGKLRNKIEDLNKSVQDILEPRAQAGQNLVTQGVIKKFNKWASDFLRDSPHKLSDSEVINNARMEILANGPNINIGTAQKIKQNLYKTLDEKYRMKGSVAVEADKTYARALKEGIESLAPEVKALNAKEGMYLELQKSLLPEFRRMVDRDLLGGKTMTFNPKIMVARMLVDSPALKSYFAIALNKAREAQAGGISTPLRMGGFQAGRIGMLENEYPMIPRELGGEVEPVKSLPFVSSPNVYNTRGVLSKTEEKEKPNLNQEKVWASEAIEQGVDIEQVRKAFRDRTGQEL